MDIASLRNEFGTLQKAYKDHLEKFSKADAPEMTAEDKSAQSKRLARMEQIDALFADESRAAALKFATGKSDNVALDDNTTFAGGKAVQTADRDAINEFLKFGRSENLRKELFATSGSTVGSSVYLPTNVATPVVNRRPVNAIRAALAAYGYQPLSFDQMITVSIPNISDDANEGGTQSETATSGTEASHTPTPITLSPTLWTSKQEWLSNTLIAAPGFDLVGYLLPLLSRRVELAQSTAWVGSLKSTATLGHTLSATTSATYNDVLKIEESIKNEYLSDAVFIVSTTAKTMLRGVVDGYGRPIFDVDPQTMLNRLHGIPLIVSDAYDAVAANKVVGCIASAEGLKVADMGPTRITRYENVPSRPDSTGFEIFKNSGFGFASAFVRNFATKAS